MIILIFFIAGLIVGSFINVVVYRLNLAESMFVGRSMCPHCRAKIRWYDNIPLLSFVLLRAECRDCKGKISWEYPMVEFLTGVAFAGIGVWFFSLANYQTWIESGFLLVLFFLLLVIFAYDLKFMEIPMIFLWAGVGAAVLWLIFSDISNFSASNSIFSLRIVSGAIGAFVAWAFFFSMAFFSKEKWMGMGDAYLAILVGLTAGWPKIFFAFVLSFSLGAIFSIFLVIFKKKSMKSQVPFAPFLVAGTIATLFLYQAFPEYLGYLFYF
ncbi:MAG: prepilin peptidase [Candidatus Moranbacteria bacterium]|jgi:leader peptidase (prepilin peptidase)/N-methyltransferase|nr:prepilin peptidase [Candidatus Moranbacteria bacterium]